MGESLETKKTGHSIPQILEDLENKCPADSLEEEVFGKAWRLNSLCSKIENPDNLFFKKTGTGPSKITCSFCPVVRECAIWALMYEEEGTWGGTSEEERAEYAEIHSMYIASLVNRAKVLQKYFPRISAENFFRRRLVKLPQLP